MINNNLRITNQAANFLAFASCLAIFATAGFAQSTKKNPVSKFYVADLTGEAQVDTGERIEALTKKSVYTAQGTVVETKANSSNALVYSNGSGIYLEPETRVQVNSFVQEPFTPNRSDMDVEPSISRTDVTISQGGIGLCTSKLVAGSSMVYQTQQAIVRVRGAKVSLQSSDTETKISLIEGEVTVRGGPQDLAGQSLRPGQQAIIRNGAAGQPNSITIQDIPPADLPKITDSVTMACMARKTVYFEVRDITTAFDSTPADGGGNNGQNGNWGQIIVPIEVVGGTTRTGPAISSARLP